MKCIIHTVPKLRVKYMVQILYYVTQISVRKITAIRIVSGQLRVAELGDAEFPYFCNLGRLQYFRTQNYQSFVLLYIFGSPVQICREFRKIYSGRRDRGPGFKTRSRSLTFTKAVTNFRTLTRCGVLIALTNSVEFYHVKDVKTLELRVMN